MAKTISVKSIIRKLYVEHDGNLIEVKEISNPEAYPKEVTIYSKVAVKGKTQGKTLYAVGVADYKAAPRTVKSLEERNRELAANAKKDGMSDKQIMDMLLGIK